MKARTKNVKFTYAAVFIICFGASFYLSPRAEGADAGYRFYSNSLSVGDCTTDYGFYTGGAVYDYNANTDLNVTYLSGSCSGTVNVVQGSYPGVTWHAAAIPMNANGQPCANFNDASWTYLCNTTTLKAVSATVYFNNLRGVYPSNDRHWAVRHELGHVFGMAHLDCFASSVMVPYEDCGIAPGSFVLRPYDIALINSWY